MTSLLSELSILPETDEQREAFKAMLINDLDSGNVDCIEHYKRLDYLEKLFKELKKEATPFAIAEAENYHKNELEEMGVQVSQKRTWNYDNYDTFNQTKAYLKEIQTKMKAAASSKNGSIFDNETGEVIPPAYPTYSDPFITITKNRK